MSGVRGSVMSGVCANSCHAQDSACATVWDAANANASLANCEAACRQCAQCRFASFSLAEGVCVWQERCKLLQLPGEDFRTLKLKRQRSRRQERALAPASTTPGPGCTGASCLHSLQSMMARSRGQPNSSSRLPRNWLLPSMLEQGVTPAPGDDRLGCFLRGCAARPVVVAAFGGSVTSGLAYKVLSAKDQGGEDFAHLYHRQLARWMGARWPVTQSRATELNQSINLGVPGTGPALTALCLTSMQPRPPDLALVEFGINANARDLPHYTTLLRSLRDAGVATVVVNVERYGSWRGCDRRQFGSGLGLTLTLMTLALALALTPTLTATARTAAPRPILSKTRRGVTRPGHPRCARSRPSRASSPLRWSTCAAPSAPHWGPRPTRSAAS